MIIGAGIRAFCPGSGLKRCYQTVRAMLESRDALAGPRVFVKQRPPVWEGL